MGKPIYGADAPPPEPARRPLLVGDGEVRAARPMLEPRAPRLLRVHPKRWTVLAGKVVPACAHVHLRVGVHMMKQRRDGLFLAREALADWSERGWTVIPEDVDGPGTSYLREVLPGTWLLRWEQEHAGSEHVSSDLEAYAEWLRGLIRTGKIEGPKPYILEAMAAKMRQAVGELRDAVRASPSRQPELDRAEADLAAVDAELGVNRPARKSAPTRKSALMADEVTGE